MKIFLDHCVPHPLRRELSGHHVITTRELGWETLKNGQLLTAAQAEGFDALLTVDQNLRLMTNTFPHQQNLQGRAVAVVMMIAGGITVEELRLLIPAVEHTLQQLQPGQLYEVSVSQQQV
jgi:hypothetical protein